ncbi:hypothetical protein [Komarekiella delphini-convector]|uniref:hypothetical protein n=1 Tax=Komarekiella delphini-convector TaxID=3050158 RepID=UPI00177BE1BB|nr:hypothetical protein [Komarekiella delphini-convector]
MAKINLINHPPGDAPNVALSVAMPQALRYANTSRLGWETRQRALVHEDTKALSKIIC